MFGKTFRLFLMKTLTLEEGSEDYYKYHDENFRLKQIPEDVVNLRLIGVKANILVIPEHIKYLTISCSNFDGYVEFPKNLISLNFNCMYYTKPLMNLPKTLKDLYIFSVKYDQPIIFPENLKTLNIYFSHYTYQLYFPKNIKTLIIRMNVYELKFNFPEKLKYLYLIITERKFGSWDKTYYNYNRMLNFPKSLILISLGFNGYDQNIHTNSNLKYFSLQTTQTPFNRTIHLPLDFKHLLLENFKGTYYGTPEKSEINVGKTRCIGFNEFLW